MATNPAAAAAAALPGDSGDAHLPGKQHEQLALGGAEDGGY
jgi:hypothetical protein